MTSLTAALYLQGNNLCGTIPAEVGEWTGGIAAVNLDDMNGCPSPAPSAAPTTGPTQAPTQVRMAVNR